MNRSVAILDEFYTLVAALSEEAMDKKIKALGCEQKVSAKRLDCERIYYI